MKAEITSYSNNVTIEESSLKVSVQSFSYSVLFVTESVIVKEVAVSDGVRVFMQESEDLVINLSPVYYTGDTGLQNKLLAMMVALS